MGTNYRALQNIETTGLYAHHIGIRLIFVAAWKKYFMSVLFFVGKVEKFTVCALSCNCISNLTYK